MVVCFILTSGEVSCPIIDFSTIAESAKHPICYIIVTIGTKKDKFFVSLDGIKNRSFDNVKYLHLNDYMNDLVEYSLK